MQQKTLRLFIGGLATETNTFSPLPTGMAAFAEAGIYRGDATKLPPRLFTAPLHEWRRLAEAEGHQVSEGLMAAAQPAGRTVRTVYESLRDELLAGLRAALPVDMVLLNLHGAMVADGYDDCEGDLLARVRTLIGPDAILGAELDLHCHTTLAMLDNADALIAYKEYPHTDTLDRARELYALCRDAALGRIRPVARMADCRLIGVFHTTREPAKSFVARMQALEGNDGILAVNFGHGFGLGDVAEVGARIWVTADALQPGAVARAELLAGQLAQEVFAMREASRPTSLDVACALDQALALAAHADKPVVLADSADNPGGGAPGDATFILQALLERQLRDVVSGIYWDPQAVALCQAVGIGARLELRIGGKLGPTSGQPLDLTCLVHNIAENYEQTDMSGQRGALGSAVHLEVLNNGGGLHLVLTSQRSQVFHPDAFTGLGIDLAAMKIVVVKSSQHFYQGFAPIAAEVLYVQTPGAVFGSGPSLSYTKRAPTYWPLVANPWKD